MLANSSIRSSSDPVTFSSSLRKAMSMLELGPVGTFSLPPGSSEKSIALPADAWLT